MTFPAVLHWLFDCENPMKLYGFFPVILWYYFSTVTLSWFFAQELPGLHRWHGMVPFTYVLRCLPRFFWIVAAAVGVWHFDFVRTKAAQILSH